LADYCVALELAPKNVVGNNDFAWFLATCPDTKLATRRKRWPWRSKPSGCRKNGGSWNTLGAAHYSAGDWKAAVKALEKSMELRKGGDAFDWFFLAMAHRKLGYDKQAREWYDRAVSWAEKNQPDNAELRRFHAEARDLLHVKAKND
jgi:tetratricopeptide (TPR) repeat protein